MPVEVLTFGCRVNLAESEAMRRAAEEAGSTDAVIVNTCAVTEEAVRQAAQAIRRARREKPDADIVVTGCAAQVEPGRFAAMPEVDRVLGNAVKLAPESWIPPASAASRIDVPDIFAPRAGPPSLAEGRADRTRAFLQVQTGCDHRCTFCVIPFGRGNSRSVPLEHAVQRAAELVDAGHAEIVLTGVDITSWGGDLPGQPRLGALVKAILRGVPALKRLRISSIDSIEADRDLLDALACEPRLMPHLHLSLQAGDDLVLKRMKRRHTRADAVAFCNTVRRLRPEIVLGADLIAGFPTESEAMFARSLDLVDECGLTHLHVFPFSPRPGTPAARMPQVEPAVVRERARRLRERGEAALRAHLDAQVGRIRGVLTERNATARTEDFTPVSLPVAMEPGRLVEVAITGHDGRKLIAA
jgi:threonylcarbamoyladenosine tRNA methylthiotransferase MtaB